MNERTGLITMRGNPLTLIGRKIEPGNPAPDFESLDNMVAMTLNLSMEQKQALLEISDIVLRGDMLVPILQQQLETLLIVRRFEHIKPENPSMN